MGETVSYWDILDEIIQYSGNATTASLARKFRIQEATVTDYLRRMNQQGFIERKRSDMADRRRILIHVTESGREAANERAIAARRAGIRALR